MTAATRRVWCVVIVMRRSSSPAGRRLIGVHPVSRDGASGHALMRRGPRARRMGVVETRTVTSGRRNSRVGITIVAVLLVGAIVVVLLRSPRYRADWSADTWGRAVLVVHLLAVAAAIGGGAFLLVRRPTNRCGVVAVTVGVALLGLFYVSFFSIPDHGWWLAARSAVTWSLRPLLFWLVLAYPVGRLDRTSRRVYVVYLLGTATTLALVPAHRVRQLPGACVPGSDLDPSRAERRGGTCRLWSSSPRSSSSYSGAGCGSRVHRERRSCGRRSWRRCGDRR